MDLGALRTLIARGGLSRQTAQVGYNMRIDFSGLFSGFGVKILGYDLYHNPEFTVLGGKYVELDTLFSEADIISLHCPLTPQTFHLIDAQSIAKMKPGVMIINTRPFSARRAISASGIAASRTGCANPKIRSGQPGLSS
jgi:hypothetical protein